MRFRRFAGLLFALMSTTAMAEIGTIDQVPAATLLFPHFEVDTNSDAGVTTVLTIQNSSATAIMGSVTLWTDYGVPTAHFNLYLTGYDNVTLDLADTFRRRFIPVTGSDGQDPQDIISPQGPISQDINFASCNGFLTEPQGSSISADLVRAHTGLSSIDYLNGQCGGRAYGDGIARGYVTVDTANQCTALKPGMTGYFVNGGAGVATNQNVMYGDYVIVDRARSRFFSETAVAIESAPTNPLTSGPGDYTFYGRLHGFSGADNREPLPTAWAGRYANGRTDVDYWRDPAESEAPFTCGSTPAPYPLGQRHVTVFNDAGGVASNPVGNLFANGVGIASGASLGLTQPLGWLFANLNAPAASGPTGAIRQSWLSFRQIPRAVPANSSMGYSVPGIQLGNAATGADPIIP